MSNRLQKSNYTLRQALKSANFNKVCYYIWKKEQNNAAECDRLTRQQVQKQYRPVVDELLNKPISKPYKLLWLIQKSINFHNKHLYADVCFLNPNYVAPKKGLKPWGCKKGQLPPNGHYNVNDEKHCQTFATGNIPWSKIIDTPIVNKAKYSLEKVVAEILWEITFFGWTEEKTKTRIKEIEQEISESIKEVESGNCVIIPPKKKGDVEIVIPNSIAKQLDNIINKKTNKCNTCMGYGMWAIGNPSPVGPLDASDGIPTIPCPECGANKNPC